MLNISIDKSSEKQYTTKYNYDKEGKLLSKIEDGIGSLEQDIEYDNKGEIRCNRYTVNDIETIEYSFVKDTAPDSRTCRIILPSGADQIVEYDGLGRTSSISLDNKFTKSVYYAKYGDHATNYVSSVWYGLNGKSEDNMRYTYDKKGNITSIKENGNLSVSYAYDSLNRLIREDNAMLSKTETYEYDNNGNIQSKINYAYTLNEALIGGEITDYDYSQSGWKDQLLSYNGKAFKYDKLGNPLTYKEKQMLWAKGRNLVSYDGNTYTYNASGIRTAKSVGGLDVTYYLDGTQIIAEEHRKNGAVINAIYYRYGADGIVGFKHNNIEYVYRKNIQGDITHIYTKDGELVVKYAYDAWGNHNIYAESGYAELANLNPFRYRGYYYDITTKLYYLNTRYYDPQTGRFINADDITYLDPETINGLNLYAYCGDNPVMYSDSTGCSPTPWWQWLIAGVVVAGLIVGSVFTGGLLGAAFIGAAIGGGISLVTQAISGELNWGQFALDIGVGALTGMLGMSGISKLGATLIGAGIGGVSNIASQLIDGTSFNEINWWKVGISAGIGGIAGFIGGAGARNTRALNSASRVEKAINSVNKVMGRMNTSFYSSARYAKSAFTQVANRLG